MKKKVLTVVGTRPNFVKISQFQKEFDAMSDRFEHRLLHTGQHYDDNMSAIFFQQLQINKPDYHLGVEKGSPAFQIGRIIQEIDAVLQDYAPDFVMVVGDVNSTLAGAIAAQKRGATLCHVESGLRSRDRSMPEEINRLLTDEIADVLFVTEQSGLDNLAAEGKAEERVAFVGNTMIDSLAAFRSEIEASPARENLGLEAKEYVLMTMHRPATVDDEEGLQRMLSVIRAITERKKLVFPIHPRTVVRMKDFGLYADFQAIEGVHALQPLDYFGFQKLITDSFAVVTDSGGIQEETTYYQVPCITLRPNTERPSTLTLGTNRLMELDATQVGEALDQIAHGDWPHGEVPPLWDGKATQRIVAHLAQL